MANEYGPSPKYICNSGNLIPGNNYISPNGPINQFPQPNSMQIPVNSYYPNQQPNGFPDQGNLYLPPNPIQNNNNSQINPMQPPEGTSFQPLNDPYSKPNPMQP